MWRESGGVSIPIGFSQALQLLKNSLSSPWRSVFQSLSGFLRPCNTTVGQFGLAAGIGFNPYRVFSGLATPGETIPHRWEESFNPYRVFSGLATLSDLALSAPTAQFQSLSGFLRPCNVDSHFGMGRWICFNPYRVFSGLATISGSSMNTGEPKRFQSLSGFLRPCNKGVGRLADRKG